MSMRNPRLDSPQKMCNTLHHRQNCRDLSVHYQQPGSLVVVLVSSAYLMIETESPCVSVAVSFQAYPKHELVVDGVVVSTAELSRLCGP
jgi:hypothetical protein